MKIDDNILTMDKIGEIMDDFLKRNEINMLVTLPEGSMKAEIQDNIGMGSVVHFYILLASFPTIFKEMFELLNLDEENKENLIDALLDLVKKETLNIDKK